MKKILYLTALAALCAAGCSTNSDGTPRNAHVIKIDSGPQGVRIFYSTDPKNPTKEFIGKTPCTYTAIAGKGGGFRVSTPSKYVAGIVVFTAQPPYESTNLFEQSQFFHTWAKYREVDPIPGALFFDMHTRQ